MPSWGGIEQDFFIPEHNSQKNNKFFGKQKCRMNHDQVAEAKKIRQAAARKKSKLAKKARKK